MDNYVHSTLAVDLNEIEEKFQEFQTNIQWRIYSFTIVEESITHMDISQHIGALLCSKMAFFKWAWWKVKVLSCPVSLLIPIRLD